MGFDEGKVRRNSPYAILYVWGFVRVRDISDSLFTLFSLSFLLLSECNIQYIFTFVYSCDAHPSSSPRMTATWISPLFHSGLYRARNIHRPIHLPSAQFSSLSIPPQRIKKKKKTRKNILQAKTTTKTFRVYTFIYNAITVITAHVSIYNFD